MARTPLPVNRSPDASTDPADAGFSNDLESSMQGLRGSLMNLLASMGDDPRTPQEVSRRYGLNKNLSWKVSKIINSSDPRESVQHVPGVAGMKILIEAFRKAGAESDVLEAVSESMDQYTEMIRLHVGDRANLELYVGSTEPDGIHSDQLEDKRRLAYQGNSAIWGVQARLGFSLRLIAPNARDADRADIVSVGGLHGFRRLRSTASWPVLQIQSLGEGVEFIGPSQEALDAPTAEGMPPLIRDFSSSPVPETRAIIEAQLTTFELCEGPVGNTAAADVTFGVLSRHQVPVWGDSPESVGEHYCRIDTPMEHAQFDLLVHRDLPFELPPRFVSYSKLHDDLHFPLSQNPRFHLPGSPTVSEMHGVHVGLVSPHIPKYSKLIALACSRLGHEPGDFRAFRVSISYPPMPTIMVLYHPLGAIQSE